MGKIWFTNHPHISMDFELPTVVGIDSIECTTDLDEGSDNKGNKGVLEGFIYGKEYEFKISKYYKDRSISEKMKTEIVWEYEYVNDNGEVINTVVKSSQDIFKLKIDNLEMLGKEICIYCHLGNQESGATVSIFCHNRFRHFDRQTIKQELNKRRNNPELANQSRTPTCGMASIFYILAKRDFDNYENFILDLHQSGIAKCNSYKVDVSDSEHLLEMNPISNTKYPQSYKKMPYIDWIPFSCVRNQENDLPINYDGEMSSAPLNQFSGATLPHEIEKLMREILGFKNIIDDTNMVFNKDSQEFGETSAKELKKLQDLYIEGYDICLFINTNMINNIKSGIFTTIEHWVVFEGIIGGTISWDEYDFKVFTWGGFEDVIINPESFRSNYYGYVAGK